MDLTITQVAWCNRLIVHCEGLIRSWGVRSGETERFQSADFLITCIKTPTRTTLRVHYYGQSVLHARWDLNNHTGTADFLPGPWEYDVLSLRV